MANLLDSTGTSQDISLTLTNDLFKDGYLTQLWLVRQEKVWQKTSGKHFPLQKDKKRKRHSSVLWMLCDDMSCFGYLIHDRIRLQTNAYMLRKSNKKYGKNLSAQSHPKAWEVGEPPQNKVFLIWIPCKKRIHGWLHEIHGCSIKPSC